jgi:hypothetical protein
MSCPGRVGNWQVHFRVTGGWVYFRTFTTEAEARPCLTLCARRFGRSRLVDPDGIVVAVQAVADPPSPPEW